MIKLHYIYNDWHLCLGLLRALIIHKSTDYITLWGATGIPVYRREQR